MRRTLALALAGLLAGSAISKADTLFNFNASGGGSSVSGTLTGTSNNNGSYTITGISGAGITGLLSTTNPYFSNDNLLFPGVVRTLDVNGIAFTRDVGGSIFTVNIFSNLGYNPPTNVQFLADTFDAAGNFNETPVTFSVTAASSITPEPSSLLLLGTGMVAVVTQLRRRLHA